MIESGQDTDEVTHGKWKYLIYDIGINHGAPRGHKNKNLIHNCKTKTRTNEEVSYWPPNSSLHVWFHVSWYWDNDIVGLIYTYQNIGWKL